MNPIIPFSFMVPPISKIKMTQIFLMNQKIQLPMTRNQWVPRILKNFKTTRQEVGIRVKIVEVHQQSRKSHFHQEGCNIVSRLSTLKDKMRLKI